ncbi:SDR family NAD(P)-dependent oxidoreductase [Demequina sp.]|uniref:SDR family NAD(P)-dependent oxidoreductase n=1 Tax=Demequina sp. TaxID=2050685 RepID=UPI003D0EC50E
MSRIFITGSAQGIGAESARQLIDMGHDVVLHGRNEERAAAALALLPDAVGAVAGDLASISGATSVAERANALGPFDAVIHNAGIGGGLRERTLTEDGLELIFHTNVVGPYVVTALMPVSPRMVYLTSGLEGQGVWRPDDLQWARREWDGMQAYSDSKLHDSMLAFELAARHPEAIVNSVDPGWIKTQLGGPNAWDEVADGAETQVWLVTSDEKAATASGRYVKRRESQEPNAVVRDVAARAELVEELHRITGLTLP